MSLRRARSAAPALHPPASPVTVRFWGVRGSVPVPGRSTVRYGGNTACIEVRYQTERVILDAGTGIRLLGQKLIREPDHQDSRISILLSHTHWDHIQGFPFFAPAYQARQRIRIFGIHGSRAGLLRTISATMESPYFPVALPQMPSHITVEEVARSSFRLGSFRVHLAPLHHPGGGVAYRLDTPAGSIAYVPDHEIPSSPASHPHPGTPVRQLIDQVDLLIHDAQYTVAEYRSRQGWGHSAVPAVVLQAIDARVRHLVLFHHDPRRTDAALDRLLSQARSLARSHRTRLRIDAAMEGRRCVLRPPTK
jgi:phosphoribosyl 1,2-cyclic phosphodiesterase